MIDIDKRINQRRMDEAIEKKTKQITLTGSVVMGTMVGASAYNNHPLHRGDLHNSIGTGVLVAAGVAIFIAFPAQIISRLLIKEGA